MWLNQVHGKSWCIDLFLNIEGNKIMLISIFLIFLYFKFSKINIVIACHQNLCFSLNLFHMIEKKSKMHISNL